MPAGSTCVGAPIAKRNPAPERVISAHRNPSLTRGDVSDVATKINTHEYVISVHDNRLIALRKPDLAPHRVVEIAGASFGQVQA